MQKAREGLGRDGYRAAGRGGQVDGRVFDDNERNAQLRARG